MHKIAVIGAGKTGRGFIGRLLSEAGRSILFVDRDRALTDRLGAQQRFVFGIGQQRIEGYVDFGPVEMGKSREFGYVGQRVSGSGPRTEEFGAYVNGIRAVEYGFHAAVFVFCRGEQLDAAGRRRAGVSRFRRCCRASAGRHSSSASW